MITNYAFFGSPRFAEIILDRLLRASLVPQVLVCNPDRPVGRKHIVTPPPTKSCIAKHVTQIVVLQPENTNELQATRYKLQDLDFAIVAAYSKIIPKEIIDLFPKGVVGVHPSLLPVFRGASPIQSAILAGEEKTGVTLYLLDEKLDHGPIIGRVKWKMENGKYTYKELHDKLAQLGGQLLVDTIPKFLRGEIVPEEQDHSKATFTKKFDLASGYVDPNDLEAALHGNKECASRIERIVRALNPEPGVWTYGKIDHRTWHNAEQKKRIKLLEATVREEKLILLKIQEEGKNQIRT